MPNRFLCRLSRVAITFVGFALSSAIMNASATNVYIAQSAAGAANGNSCANAYAITFFNSAGTWGSGTTQIGAGTTVHFCGTITSSPQVQGSGTSGNPITFVWEPGARITLRYGQMISLGGSNAYLTFDGGIPCGPKTNCNTVEAANQRGYASGQTGIIEATANGSALANQNANTQAFYGCILCHDIEIRNLIIRNLYVHSLMSDSTSSADTGNSIFQCPGGGSGCGVGLISIHDLTVHDVGNALQIERTAINGGGNTTVNVFNVDFYHMNWAVENSGDGTRIFNFYNNYCHDTANWDTTSDAFHHNCLHMYLISGTTSVATTFYNNLSYGDWGLCCSTATQMYLEFATPNNFNVFNNVSIQYGLNIVPSMLYGGAGSIVANNTWIGTGFGGGRGNTECGAYGGTALTIENNACGGWGQYLAELDGAATFTTWDYNQYGPTGNSGNPPFVWHSSGYTNLAAFQSVCSCDTHSAVQTDFKIDANGLSLAGSPLIGAGVNLTSVCSGQPNPGLGALCFDAAGNARPSSGGWDVGAYQHVGSSTIAPSGLLSAVAQ